jgi:manganese efflux pump family protein
MEHLTIFFIAIGLSFDSFAVATSSGFMLKNIRFTEAMKISFSFAFFQGLMPVLGWLAGSAFKHYIENIDHWIAFGLLLIIGLKMIIESLKHESKRQQLNPLDLKVMVSMSLATSIDALIIGISFAIISYNIVISVLVIGSVTFIIAMLGILFGKKAGKHLGQELDIIGGLILIAMGTKILIEHLYFS